MAKQIFQGIKIADFAWVGVGPLTARELAFHGATVIRVECHRYPETLRTTGPFKDGVSGIDRSAFYPVCNTNKYDISLDLNRPKAKEIAYRLIKWSDIVTDGMTPGTMAKWGLDYESCKKIKPDIIYFSTCQMGQKGPLANVAGYGVMGVSYAGFSQLTGWADRGPLPLNNNYSDWISPWYLATTLIAALVYRRKTGKGMYLNQAQVEAGASFLGPLVLDYIVNGRIAGPLGNHDPYLAPHNVYPCSGDDRWVAITVREETEWNNLCQVMGQPRLASDPRFATLLSRKQNEGELDKLISEWTKNYTPQQLMEMLQSSGVPCGVVQTAEDLFNDPQLGYRHHFNFLEHKVIGRHAYQSPAYRLSKTPAHLWRAGPCLGQDNEYVYKELLGYSDDEIADLLVEGVITTEDDLPTALMG